MGVNSMRRVIKLFITVAAGMFIVMTLLSLLIPSTVSVSRTIIINNAVPADIYTQVAKLENWKNWHPVVKDTAALFLPETTNKDERDTYSIGYNGKISKLVLVAADSGSVKFLLQFTGEIYIENEIKFIAIPLQQNVQVEWQALNTLKWYPWEKFYGIFVDKLTGPGYEAGLKGLKQYLESQ
jgi:hypothetical protein